MTPRWLSVAGLNPALAMNLNSTVTLATVYHLGMADVHGHQVVEHGLYRSALGLAPMIALGKHPQLAMGDNAYKWPLDRSAQSILLVGVAT